MDSAFGGATGATGSPMGTADHMAFEYVAIGAPNDVDAGKMGRDLPSTPSVECGAPVDASQMLISPDTLAAYRRDMAGFTGWCSSRGEHALPATPATVEAYVAGLLGAGRKPKGVLRVGTAINWVHRSAGLPAPWPSSRALLAALEERVPEAFVQEAAGIRTPDDERRDVLLLLEWAGQQMPGAERAFVFLRGYIERGAHVNFAAIPVEERFDDRGDGAEAHTVCEICGHVAAVGAHATDEDCRRHRCP